MSSRPWVTKVDRQEHGGLLAEFGVDPKEILDKLGGLGDMFGKR